MFLIISLSCPYRFFSSVSLLFCSYVSLILFLIVLLYHFYSFLSFGSYLCFLICCLSRFLISLPRFLIVPHLVVNDEYGETTINTTVGALTYVLVRFTKWPGIVGSALIAVFTLAPKLFS